MDAPRTSRLDLTVFLGLCGVFALTTYAAYQPYSFLHGDSAFYATVNRSLLDGHLDQHAYQPMSWYDQRLSWNDEMDAGWSNIALGRRGEYWPKHPLLLPILATPFYALFGYDGLLLANVLMFVSTLWLAYRIAARWCRPEAAALTVVVLAGMPIFTRVAYSYSNDILYSMLGVAGVERFLAGKFGFSGLLFGLAIVSKPTTAILALPFGAWLVWRRLRHPERETWRPAVQMLTWAAPPVLAWLAANWWMFGSPLTTSYNRIIVRHEGHQALFDIAAKFHRPWRQGLKEVFFAPYEGLVENAWLSFAGVLGLPFLVRAAPLLAVALVGSMVGFLWFYVPFEYTYARFFLPWAALLAVPLALLVDRIGEAAAKVRARQPRRMVWLAAVVVLVAGATWLRHRDTHRWHAVGAITQASVTRNPGAQAVPCDYFNPSIQKWECAAVEADAWQRWGLAMGDQCQFVDGKVGQHGWLWLHPNPGAAKRITWNNVPPGPLRVRYGLAPSSRLHGVRLQILDGGAVAQEVTLGDVGQIHEVVLPRHGTQVGLEVPAQANEWRQLCADLIVD